MRAEGRMTDFNTWNRQSSVRSYYQEDTNRPANLAGWGTLLTLTGSSNDYTQQIAIGNFGADARMAIRTSVVGQNATGWEYLQSAPVIAYSNSSGTSGTVTMSYDAANYKHIRISFRNDDGQDGTITYSGITNCTGTTYGTIVRKTTSDNSIMLNSALFAISGTTITISRNSQGNIVFGGAAKTDPNKLYIRKVEMWK